MGDLDLGPFHASRSTDHQTFRSACYAPFVSLSFDMTGGVSVCAFTRATSLGRVGEIPLAEMWRGDRIRRLREAVERDDLSYACSRCAEEIVGGNLHGALAVGFDQFTAQPLPEWPTRMEFALSTRCNLQCVMCAGEFSSAIRTRREGLPPLPEPYGEAFLAELDPFLGHLEQARFLGGEPFLAEINFRIWERMVEQGLQVDCNVTTNGTCWTPRVERVLESLPFSIGVSIDGATRTTVESIRAGASFDEVMANLARFVAYRDRTGGSLSLTFCLMAQNVHEFVDYLLMAEDLGCQVYVNTVRQPPEYSLYCLPTDELTLVVDRLDERADRTRHRLTINRSVLDEQLERLHGCLAERAADPAEFVEVAAVRRRGEDLLALVTDPALSEVEVAAILRAAAADGRVSVVRCDADDRILDGERYIGLDLDSLNSEPASVLHPLLAEQLGHRVDVIAARAGGGVSARVMSFGEPGQRPSIILTMVRRTDPRTTTRFAALLQPGAPRARPVELTTTGPRTGVPASPVGIRR